VRSPPSVSLLIDSYLVLLTGSGSCPSTVMIRPWRERTLKNFVYVSLLGRSRLFNFLESCHSIQGGSVTSRMGVHALRQSVKRLEGKCQISRKGRTALSQRVQIDAFVVASARLPAAVKDSYPFECQRANGGLIGAVGVHNCREWMKKWGRGVHCRANSGDLK
jgi:hypothetical protein